MQKLYNMNHDWQPIVVGWFQLTQVKQCK